VKPPKIFVLGGHQTDFARNWTREGLGLVDLLRESLHGALEDARLDPGDVGVAHVGNFVAELFTGQGHLGAFVIEAEPALVGLPTARHEAACASGSIAALSAMADLEAGRYDVALVLGVELMRNGTGFDAQQKLGAAGWVPRETEGLDYPWPALFSRLGDEYDRRYGLDSRHLMAIARQNFENARRNPKAQTRSWRFEEGAFGDDAAKNPTVAGRLRKQDCSQVTDGSAAVLLASEGFASQWARRRGTSLGATAQILGWGHRTDRVGMDEKLVASRGDAFVCPQVRGAIEDALRRAGLPDAGPVDVIETHDCFTTTQYMAIDHFGLTPPGESWRALEEGLIAFGGKKPMNPSGGLMGAGHPVGATGVRMLLDAARQVTGRAGETQVEGARTAATLNIGGSATTSVCLVVGRE
jgi:acetyl-CoA C-acetyltransferase